MRKTLAAILTMAFLVPISAYAQRADTRNLTCNQVTALVKQRRAVVLSTGTHTYDRYVYNRRSCGLEESLKQRFVDTKSGKCRVFICYSLGRLGS